MLNFEMKKPEIIISLENEFEIVFYPSQFGYGSYFSYKISSNQWLCYFSKTEKFNIVGALITSCKKKDLSMDEVRREIKKNTIFLNFR